MLKIHQTTMALLISQPYTCSENTGSTKYRKMSMNILSYIWTWLQDYGRPWHLQRLWHSPGVKNNGYMVTIQHSTYNNDCWENNHSNLYLFSNLSKSKTKTERSGCWVPPTTFVHMQYFQTWVCVGWGYSASARLV